MTLPFSSRAPDRSFDYIPALPIQVQDSMAAERKWADRSRPVSIGDDCWIGINVVILPGVTVGRGCVIDSAISNQ